MCKVVCYMSQSIKRRDKLRELKGMNREDLVSKVRSMEEELMKLRFQHAVGQLEKTAQFRTIRRDVARARTIMQSMVVA